MKSNRARYLPGAIVIEGHVQGLSNVRSLGELGISVYVVDKMHCLARYSRYCSKFFHVDDFASEAFINFLVDLAKSEELKGWMLVASNDHIVENLSLHKDIIEPYYRVLVPQKDDLYRIINKLYLLDVAKECGVPIPETCSAADCNSAGGFRYPVLIRGALGLTFYKSFHKKAIQVDSYGALKANIQKLNGRMELSEVMIQELVPESKGNGVVSFTCFAIEGDIKSFWMGRKLREHPIKYGTGTLAVSVYVQEILDYARILVSSLNYTGVCEIEFMLDPRDQRYKLIEINPRTWLWVGLAKACGVDYAKMMYYYLNGEEQSFPKSYTLNVKWVNSLTDLTFSAKMLLQGSLTLREYAESLKGTVVHAVWSWNDLLPGILYPFLSFYIAKNRA